MVLLKKFFRRKYISGHVFFDRKHSKCDNVPTISLASENCIASDDFQEDFQVLKVALFIGSELFMKYHSSGKSYCITVQRETFVRYLFVAETESFPLIPCLDI